MYSINTINALNTSHALNSSHTESYEEQIKKWVIIQWGANSNCSKDHWVSYLNLRNGSVNKSWMNRVNRVAISSVNNNLNFQYIPLTALSYDLWYRACHMDYFCDIFLAGSLICMDSSKYIRLQNSLQVLKWYESE